MEIQWLPVCSSVWSGHRMHPVAWKANWLEWSLVWKDLFVAISILH